MAVAAFEKARARAQAFDLVILDLTVPGGMGGVTVLARLREIDPDILAVASSGYSGDSVMANPAAHGFAGRLTKPYTSAEMGTLIAQVLRRRK
jgi:two-component system cell cycle sensor histidine kinase/response regulator CckA